MEGGGEIRIQRLFMLILVLMEGLEEGIRDFYEGI